MAIYNYATISSHIHSEFIILPFYALLSETITASLHEPYSDTGIYINTGDAERNAFEMHYLLLCTGLL